MRNLKDRLKILIDQGEIEEKFKIGDIIGSNAGKVFLVDTDYSRVSIQTTLANHSIGPGDRKGQAVKSGGAIYFRKHVESGTYSLFDEDENILCCSNDPSCEFDSTVPPTSVVESEKEEGDEADRIARDFVAYLRSKPFQISIHQGSNREWYPESPVTGWERRVHCYKWGRAGWNETKNTTDSFIERISRIRAHNGALQAREIEAEAVYRDIIDWGNSRGTKLSGRVVLDCLEKVWKDEIDAVNSTLTKLYAFARPDEYVIYDSRVGTAILSIAEDLYRYRSFSKNHPYCPRGSASRIESVNIYFRSVYSHLGKYDGAGGTRPRAFRYSDWPTGYGSVHAQLEANDLCCRIVRHLNILEEDGRRNWNLREVEAVLFMEGY